MLLALVLEFEFRRGDIFILFAKLIQAGLANSCFLVGQALNFS